MFALATTLCETILRGVALFEREKRYREARHYLGRYIYHIMHTTYGRNYFANYFDFKNNFSPYKLYGGGAT